MPFGEAPWRCPYCSASNAGPEPACVACGWAPAADAGYDSSPAGASGELTLIAEAPAPEPAVRARLVPGMLGAAVALALLVAAALGFLALRARAETLTVVGFEWRRAIEVEARRAVREEAWEGEVPEGARVLWRVRRRYQGARAPAGAQPRDVYRDRVGYEIERWVADRTERAQGTDQIPRWPPVRLGADEREARRSETCLVLLKGRRVYIMELPKQRWSALREGEVRRARIRSGRVLELG